MREPVFVVHVMLCDCDVLPPMAETCAVHGSASLLGRHSSSDDPFSEASCAQAQLQKKDHCAAVQISFLWIDLRQQPDFAKTFNVTVKDAPTAVVVAPRCQLRSLHRPASELHSADNRGRCHQIFDLFCHNSVTWPILSKWTILSSGHALRDRCS